MGPDPHELTGVDARGLEDRAKRKRLNVGAAGLACFWRVGDRRLDGAARFLGIDARAALVHRSLGVLRAELLVSSPSGSLDFAIFRISCFELGLA